LKADFTPSKVSAEDIFSRFKALKLIESLSEFKWFEIRGCDFKMVLALLVSMVAGPDKTVIWMTPPCLKRASPSVAAPFQVRQL
jgi:hypothetical protein